MKEAEANKLKLTPEFLELRFIEAIANNSKIFFGNKARLIFLLDLSPSPFLSLRYVLYAYKNVISGAQHGSWPKTPWELFARHCTTRRVLVVYCLCSFVEASIV